MYRIRPCPCRVGKVHYPKQIYSVYCQGHLSRIHNAGGREDVRRKISETKTTKVGKKAKEIIERLKKNGPIFCSCGICNKIVRDRHVYRSLKKNFRRRKFFLHGHFSRLTAKKLSIKERRKFGSPGPKNPNWAGGTGMNYCRGKDWKKQKVRCYKRDEYRCQGIYTKFHHKVLNVHHKIPYRICKHNKLPNLITLCRICHCKAEAEYHRSERCHTRVIA